MSHVADSIGNVVSDIGSGIGNVVGGGLGILGKLGGGLTGGISSGGGGNMGNLGPLLQVLSQMTSGGMGLARQNQLNQLTPANLVYDPRAEDRTKYAGMLSALESDPSSITKLPGYEAGEQATLRGVGKQGYLGSGKMLEALANFGATEFGNESKRLGTLAGMGMGPVNVGGPLVAAKSGSGDMLSSALATLGFGPQGSGGGIGQLLQMLGIGGGGDGGGGGGGILNMLGLGGGGGGGSILDILGLGGAGTTIGADAAGLFGGGAGAGALTGLLGDAGPMAMLAL